MLAKAARLSPHATWGPYGGEGQTEGWNSVPLAGGGLSLLLRGGRECIVGSPTGQLPNEPLDAVSFMCLRQIARNSLGASGWTRMAACLGNLPVCLLSFRPACRGAQLAWAMASLYPSDQE